MRQQARLEATADVQRREDGGLDQADDSEYRNWWLGGGGAGLGLCIRFHLSFYTIHQGLRALDFPWHGWWSPQRDCDPAFPLPAPPWSPAPPPPPGQVQPQFLCYRPPNPGFACGSPICCRSSAPTLQPFWVRPLQPHGAEACLPSSAQGCRPGRALGVPTGRGRCVPGSLIIETDPKVACQWAASFLGVCL